MELLALLKEIKGRCYFLSPKPSRSTGVDWVASSEDGDALHLDVMEIPDCRGLAGCCRERQTLRRVAGFRRMLVPTSIYT